MAFYSYEGVSDEVLDKVHTTSTGETYTLRHNDNLKVEMQYLGKGNSNTNSQGWERDSTKYFDSLYQGHPEMFSKKNVARIKDGHAPIVDSKMISYNPGWSQYRNQPLVHHHIGGNGEAVAVPKNAHKGQGEIHNSEKAAGITDNCKRFSKSCGQQPDSIGKTTSQLHAQRVRNSNVKPSQSGRTHASNSVKHGSDLLKNSSVTNKRSDVVRDSLLSNKSFSMASRSNSVRTATSSNVSHSSLDRSDAVKSSVENGSISGHNYSSVTTTGTNSADHSLTSSSSGSGGGHSSTTGSSHSGSSGGSSQRK